MESKDRTMLNSAWCEIYTMPFPADYTFGWWQNEEDEKELRNLEFSITDMKDDLITYGKHMLPVLIFFVIGILSLPGWPICCFCCCCNCCCCCCCKKPGCKIPCFIFTYLFYGLSIVICLYGITQANKIFVGLADTECSMLRFFEQVLEGETKQTIPRWPGLELRWLYYNRYKRRNIQFKNRYFRSVKYRNR